MRRIGSGRLICLTDFTPGQRVQSFPQRRRMLHERELLDYTKPMKPILRTVLLWVMVFAMPVQGMAASLMTFCGPSHTRMMQGVEADHAGKSSAHAHDHGEQHPSSVHAALGDGDGSDRDSTFHDGGGLVSVLGQFSCSACAACCSVMGFPANMQFPRQPEFVQAIPSPSIVPVQSHLPDGLDRPPREILA